jgi:peptidoglycan hydrolase CwlO-like protein
MKFTYVNASIGKIITDEISRMTTSYENNARERNELIEEKDKLLSNQEKGKKSLIKQINDMDNRIDKISVFIKGEQALLGSSRGEEKSEGMN